MSETRVRNTGGLVLVGVGAIIGTLARYGLGQAWQDAAAVTLVVNLVGAFVLGWLVTVTGRVFSEERGNRLRLFLGSGLLGGFTTYSGLAVVIAQAALGEKFLWSFGYAAVTLVVGLAASLLGIWAGGLRQQRAGVTL